MAEQINSPGWATYLRVSDEDKQSPERSFAMQRRRIQEQLLTPSNMDVTQEYCDMLTGTSSNRADYQKMLADAQSGKFSHLGLYRADRFGRDAAEGLQAATRLIGMGIKVRVANMPSLTPETPDGFFMFLIQMGLAQREVDVLKLRTADGMEAKLRAGGWAHKAPEGYINKERQVSSNKYERWVEQDPEYIQMIRQAWDLLLTDRYTMAEICEELHARGFTRKGGRPWVWDDPKRNIRVRAKNRLHQIYHNPFYAGWVVSERFGIKVNEIRGRWEAIISTEEFEQGVEILRKHDLEKSRQKKRNYLLRNLLWVRTTGRTYKMYGSSPKPRKRSYFYYITYAKPNGSQIRISCERVDEQIASWLNGIQVNEDIIPNIQTIYQTEIQQAVSENQTEKASNLKRRVSQLQDEEARLGRLFMTEKISEETYERLHAEWREKSIQAKANLRKVEQDTTIHVSNLDLALALMTCMSGLFQRLDEKQKPKLLQIMIKRIIVNPQGEILDYVLHSPFEYLKNIVQSITPSSHINRSGQVMLGVLFFFISFSEDLLNIHINLDKLLQQI